MGIYSASHPDNTYVHNIIIVLYIYMCMRARSTIHMYPIRRMYSMYVRMY